MRKTMQKEVQFTKVVYVIVEVVDGTPKMSDNFEEKFLGNLTEVKAVNRIKQGWKEHIQIIVTELQTEKVKYEMTVEDFIKHADEATE